LKNRGPVGFLLRPRKFYAVIQVRREVEFGFRPDLIRHLFVIHEDELTVVRGCTQTTADGRLFRLCSGFWRLRTNANASCQDRRRQHCDYQVTYHLLPLWLRTTEYN
jgi:hypothetical protein